jgi:hypothetical protein
MLRCVIILLRRWIHIYIIYIICTIHIIYFYIHIILYICIYIDYEYPTQVCTRGPVPMGQFFSTNKKAGKHGWGYVNMYIYTYIQTYIYIYIYIYMSTYTIHIHEYEYLWVHIHIYVYIHKHMYINTINWIYI